MSFCPECGEQIAKEDVFCPFCGITLKPIAPVQDDSMSETIVSMPPLGFEIPPADVTALQETPKFESPHGVYPETEKPVAEEAKVEDSTDFSAIETEENSSIENKPAETAAQDVKSVPLPSVFGDDDQSQVVSGPIAADNQNAESEKSDMRFDFSNAPTPSIIRADGSEKIESAAPEKAVEYKENKDAQSENLPSEISESASSDLDEKKSDTLEESVYSENPAESSKDAEIISEPAENNQSPEELNKPIEDSFAVPSEISSDTDEESRKFSESPIPGEIAETTESNLSAEPESEISKSIAENSAEAEMPQNELPVAKVENPKTTGDFPEKSAEIKEPPIAMPDAPLAMDEQSDATKFDSVQIFQKDELAPELAQIQPLTEKPVEKRETPPSSTTPNIGNTNTDGRKAAKLKPLDEGTILNNRYEVVRKIGGGGMGAVYLANDRNLGGVLRAVKEMVQSYIESEQQDKAVHDFKRESLLLTSLEHPAIPTIYDYFLDEKEGRFYLVMKYISGGDLAGRLRAAPEGRIDEKSVTEWAIQIADVLDYLHNHEPSIVYRDLKPANVMIDGNSGRVMLIDFGIARWVNKEEKGVTAVGTMGYAPPELFSGNVEARSDIYSLGSTMFHLLTGADPQSNPLLIFDFQKNPRPRQINSQLSDQIEQVLIRAVEYNAEARFTSAAEMREALKEHLANLQNNKVTFGVKIAPSNRAFSEQAVFCGFCGKQIVATDVFCAFCGAQQPIAQQNFSQPSVAVQPLTAKLVLAETGEIEPSTFRLEKTENLLGRRDPMSNIFPEVDLSKYDPQTKISRRHARIWREGNSFLVEDLGSSNGTTLLPSANDPIRLLPHQPRTLTNGDKIKVGDTTLHFTIG